MQLSKTTRPLAFLLPFLLGACQQAAPGPILQTQAASPPVVATAPAVATNPPAPLPPAPVPATFDVAALADQVKPLVVSITTTQADTDGDGQDPFDFFFGPRGRGGGGGEKQQRPRGPRRVAAGSGFIIDSSGLVITNDHVVHDATDVRVHLADERELKAEIIGRDQKLDLALLRVQAKNLPAAPLGSSEQLRVGEHVVAVGNPFGLGHTVTLGIVSAKARVIGIGPYDDFIQTDASINPGNSGGPLFNWRGEVVGINAAIRAGASGIGFAIPVDDLKSVLAQLKEKGHVDRGALALHFQPVSPDLATAFGLDAPKGALVAEVIAGGAAANAGIHAGDVVLAVNGSPVTHAEELPRKVAANAPGTVIKVTFLRNKKEQTVNATLGTMPDDDEPRANPHKAKPDKIDADNRLGIAISDTNGNGVRVDDVLDGSNVRDLEPGDVIVDVNGSKVVDTASLKVALKSAKPGTTALLKVRRGRAIQFAAIPIPAAAVSAK